jgi:hypothetical protein
MQRGRDAENRKLKIKGRLKHASCLGGLVLLLAGCQQHPYKPATALHSPASFNSGAAFLYQPPPHPLIAVLLPQRPEQKAKVQTVLSVLAPRPPVRPVRPTAPPPPVQVRVQELAAPPRATRPVATAPATAPARPPAATQP